MDGSVIIVGILIVASFFTVYREERFSKVNKKEYMKSQKWATKREQILKRDGYMCVKCLSPDRLEIHHITYKRLGNEKSKDLATLCRNCHQKVHDKYGYDYNSTFHIDGRLID